MLCPEELAAITTAAAIGLSKGRSASELAVLSVVFGQIASVLGTIAAQQAAIEASSSTTPTGSGSCKTTAASTWAVR